MKVKKFTTYDQMYNKRVDAFNVIMTPEEKELFEQGLEYAKDDFDTADKLKKFIRRYEPYDNTEKEEFPDGAYNTVIFEDMFLNTILDFMYSICLTGLYKKTIDSQKRIIELYSSTTLKENK